MTFTIPHFLRFPMRRSATYNVPDAAPTNRAPHRTGISCPFCSSADCYRSKRNGWRDFIRRRLGMFPWRCKTCRNRFYLRKRSLAT